jgi:AraC-like DNA-binding protein
VLRVGALALVPSVLREHGHDPAEILAEAGLSPGLLSDPDNRLSLSARCHLATVCSRRLQCPHFGVLVGQRVELCHLGLAGVLLRCSRTVQQALDFLVRYQRFHIQLNVLRIDCGKYSALFSYREPCAADGSEQIGDGVLAGLCSLMRVLCGADWVPNQVHFAHPAPADLAPFRNHFRCPLVFSDNEYALSFPARYLSRQISDVEPGLLQVVVRQVENDLFPPEVCFSTQVYESIETSMRSGKATSTTIAALLGLPIRTLSRNLERQGLSFQRMLDEVRYRNASRMLKDLRVSVAQIAEFLGYKDAASFSRAFRRWCGKTPIEWRSALVRAESEP